LHIALLEDDPDQAAMLSLWLEGSGHTCQHFSLGAELLEALETSGFDLYLIDWELPDTSGLKVVDELRTRLGWTVPVLFVTVRDSEDDVVKALEHGADDYMVKPLRQMEILARIHALARRRDSAPPSDTLRFGDLELDTARRTADRSGESIALTETEFELALFLLRNIGRLLPRDKILEEVWKRGPEFNTRTVDTHVSRLRKKLGLNPEHGWRLSSIYRFGYRLEQIKP
jgi:DNA-binding response OmpR family regulator